MILKFNSFNSIHSIAGWLLKDEKMEGSRGENTTNATVPGFVDFAVCT